MKRFFGSSYRASWRRIVVLRLWAKPRDGVAGLELCRQLKPDLVLLDLGIPELSGEQLAEALFQELPDCRVLVVSADDDP